VGRQRYLPFLASDVAKNGNSRKEKLPLLTLCQGVERSMVEEQPYCICILLVERKVQRDSSETGQAINIPEFHIIRRSPVFLSTEHSGEWEWFPQRGAKVRER
jgi:hypothetical protein